MLSPSHCDKCGGTISERVPWHNVELVCFPREKLTPELEQLQDRAEYHPMCFASEAFPYIAIGAECQLPTRTRLPPSPSCDSCDQRIGDKKPHFCILSTLIVDGWSAGNKALGMFCAQCVEGKRIELVRKAEGG